MTPVLFVDDSIVRELRLHKFFCFWCQFLADNIGLQKDEYNDTEDWIELFNRTNQVLDLSNTYLATKASTLNKWKFPAHTVILPNSYLTIWADDDSTQQVLHTNFALNKQADTIYLSRNSIILDSVSFINQQADTSYGRYPNGTGSFVQMNTTYNAENNNFPLSTSYVASDIKASISPIPASSFFNVNFKGYYLVEVFNMQGQLMYNEYATDHAKINCSEWASGSYLVRLGGTYHKVSVIK